MIMAPGLRNKGSKTTLYRFLDYVIKTPRLRNKGSETM